MRTKDFRIHQEQRIKKRKEFIYKNAKGYPSTYSKTIIFPIDSEKTNDSDKFYYKRYSLGNNYTNLKRRDANRRVRRHKNDISNHGGYKKIFDLWWISF